MNTLHAGVFKLTGGRVGGRLLGLPMLFLETVGSRSGRRNTTPLLFGRDGDNLIVVGSKGGAPHHPAWYGNLVAHPEVSVQVGRRRLPMRARTASPEEKPRLWTLMVRLWPDYESYQRGTDREIPVIILEPRL